MSDLDFLTDDAFKSVAKTGTQLPTTDEAFGPDLPTTDEAFGPEDKPKTYAGEIWDYAYGHAKNDTVKELNAYGQGFKQAWGAEPLGLSEDTEKHLGILNGMKDFKEGRGNIIKAANEAWMRTAAYFGDALWRGTSAHFAGLLNFTRQGLVDLGASDKLADTLAGVVEYKLQTGMPEAHFGVPPEARFVLDQDPLRTKMVVTQTARAEAVIGEPEAQYFGTKKPTPEEAQARQEASQAVADIRPEPVKVPDIHEVARTIAPEVFSEYDKQTGYRNYYRNQIAELSDKVPENPKIKELQDQIDVLEDREKLTNKQQDRLNSLNSELDSTPKKIDTQELSELRQKLLEADYKMRDLAPDVATAYRQAQEHIGSQVVETPIQSSSTTSQEAVQTDTDIPGTPVATPTEASQGVPKAVSEGVQSIQGQVYDALTKAGRPSEEAKAIAKLLESHYEARASRFYGKLGTPQELFDKDFPEIRQSGEFKGKGKTYEQANHTSNDNTRESNVIDLSNQPAKEDHPAAKQLGQVEGLKTNYQPYDTYDQTRKGSLTVTPEGQKNVLRLFKDADASTFLHETGHQWLEELSADAHHPEAPTPVKADWISIKNWLKVKDDQKGLSRKQHEQFARGFERYLMEGQAPSPELISVFQKFKDWLTKIYQTVLNLKSPINNDIRDVFDRLVTKQIDRSVVAPETEIHSFTPEEISAPKAEPEPAADNNGKTVGSPSATLPKEPEEFVDKAGNIKLDNVTSDADLKDVIRDVVASNKEFISARRGVVTAQDRLDIAQAIGADQKTVDKVLEYLSNISGEKTGTPLSASVQALKKVMEQAAVDVRKAVATNDPVAYADASSKLVRYTETFSGITAEWGRTGQALKKVQDPSQMADIIKATTGKTYYQLLEEMKKIRRLDTTAKVVGFVKDAEKASLGEMIQEFYVNRLISGPKTHLTYLAGQELFTVYRVLENAVQAGVSKIHEGVDLVRGKTGDIDPKELTYIGEAKQDLYALWSGHINGIKAAGKAFQEGKTQLLPGEERTANVFLGSKAIPDFRVGPVPVPVGSIIRLPSERMVAPIHSLNRTVAYTVARDRLIYKQVASEGLEGASLQKRIGELQENTPVDITVQARADASEASLMGKSGDFTRKVIGALHHQFDLPVLGRFSPGAIISPFISIASNINRLAFLERSPLGLFAKNIRADLWGENGRLAQDTAMTKMAFGTSVYLGVSALQGMGYINGSGPSDYKEAAVWKMTHGLPNSVKVGDMSYAFDRLGVLGSMMSMAANTSEFINNRFLSDDQEARDKASVNYFNATWEHMTAEGMASGLSDVFRAAHEPDQYGQTWAQNFLSTAAVGVGSSQVAQSIDPYSRDTHGLTFPEKLENALKAKTPFASEDLQPKVDLFGQPIPNRGFEGVYTQKLSDDPVWIALNQTSYFPAPVKRDINGVKLTNDQYHEYASQAGYLAHMMLYDEVTQPWFTQLDHKMQHELIKTAFEKSRSIASGITKANHPDIVVTAINNKYNLAGQ